MKMNTHWLIAIILLTSLFANAFASKSKYCQRKPNSLKLSKALKMQKNTTRCAGELLYDHLNITGIPTLLRIPKIICRPGTGDHCIQLMLPIFGANGHDGQPDKYVKSGCVDRSHAKKKSGADKGTGKKGKDKSSLKARRRRSLSLNVRPQHSTDSPS